MTFAFRIRFSLTGRTFIDDPSARWSLNALNSVVLHSSGDVISSSQAMVLTGVGYETAETATTAANSWQAILMMSLASEGIGADFGIRNPRAGVFTEDALLAAATASGASIANDKHGILVYPDDDVPLMIAASLVDLTKRLPGDSLLQTVLASRDLEISLTEGVQLAYELFSSAQSESSADARFVMLMMALETLIQQVPRSEKSQELIDELCSFIECKDDLPDGEAASLVRCVTELKREAVSKAGRRLAKQLKPKTYMRMSAVDFFQTCYKLRSELVHGYVERPSIDEINKHVPHLLRFVADLITIPLRNA